MRYHGRVLDDRDRIILAALQRDARATFATLASIKPIVPNVV